jgi:hypothetical protein
MRVGYSILARVYSLLPACRLDRVDGAAPSRQGPGRAVWRSEDEARGMRRPDQATRDEAQPTRRQDSRS